MKAKKYTKLFEWQERIKNGDFKCEKCGLTDKRYLSIDHIIPVSILKDLYLDTEKSENDLIYNDEENFQVLCRYCNTQKGERMDIRNPKTKELLLKVLKVV